MSRRRDDHEISRNYEPRATEILKMVWSWQEETLTFLKYEFMPIIKTAGIFWVIVSLNFDDNIVLILPLEQFHAHQGWRNSQPAITNWSVDVLAGRCRSVWKESQKPIIQNDLRTATVILFCLPFLVPSPLRARNSMASSFDSQAKRVFPMCGWDYGSNLPRSRFLIMKYSLCNVLSFAEHIFLLCTGTYSWISSWIYCLKATHTLEEIYKNSIFRLIMHITLLIICQWDSSVRSNEFTLGHEPRTVSGNK